MKLIPFSSNPIQPDTTFSVDLGSKTIALRVIWNEAAQAWFMDIARSETDNPLIAGLKLVPNIPLLDNHRAMAPFSGDLICLKLSDDAKEVATLAAETYTAIDNVSSIGYSDLGVFWGLVWMNTTELESWKTYYGLG